MKKIIIGNWKMNPLGRKEAVKLMKQVARSLPRVKNTEIVVCPPVIFISDLKNISKKVSLGAQDTFWGDVGPFTGEISAEMLYDLGARYVILGHSERRALGEKNSDVNKKLKAVLASSLTPILCIGEKDRDHGHQYFDVVKNQIIECLQGVNKNLMSRIIFAYEPVWAISSTVGRRDATSEDSREMSIFMRKVLADLSSPDIASKSRIIYGGSVTDRDVEDFLKLGGVSGALVGRASLDPIKFAEIVRIAEK